MSACADVGGGVGVVGYAHDRRTTVVQEVHVEIGDLFAVIVKPQLARRFERADGGRLDIFACA